uniref:Uncharacterized LOC103386730 n=2 Tax=Cynoglossus semilaevis TaxID=244447 RepID=A0A3P8UI34_CYNSE
MTFHRVDQHQENPTVMSLTEAAAHGYHISVRGSFLIFRCLYSSNFSYIIKDSGVDLELVSATVFYPFLSSFLAIDATVACTLNDATVDQSDLLWTLPLVPSPLVHGLFKYKGVTFGVDGRAFSESDIEQGGYKISLQRRRVEVRIPTGASGVHVKSVVVQGRYSQSISVDLSIMSQWENKHWPWTQLRIFRRLKALIPATHFLNRNRTTSNDSFSATLGPFAPDVSLEKVTLTSGGDLLTWTSSHHPQHDKDFVISKLSNNTGSYTFQLCFPLSHPKIIPEFIGGGVKTYSFTFIFTFNISPSGEVFYHQEEVEHSVEYTAPSSPKLEGKCTDSSLLVLLHHGAHTQLQWELFLGNQRLDWELAEMGGFVVETGELYVTVEIPMYSPVLSFEELTLRGVIAGIKLFLVDAVSLKILASLDFNCNFPVRELLVCLPQGRMVAVVDTTHTIPPVQPNRTLDPSCVPLQTDSSRALFSFSLDSCGTTVTTEGQFLVYENQISYKQDFLPVYDPVIHRDSPYRLTIQCRYPANDSSALTVQYPVNSAMNLSEIIPVKQTKSSI